MRAVIRFASVLALAVLLAGCGGGSGSTADQAPTSQPTTAETAMPPPVSLAGLVTDHGVIDLSGSDTVELDLTVGDSFFDPTFVKVDPGAEVTVHLTNDGSLDHTFTIDSLSVDQQLEPGEQEDVTFTMPDNGAVRFYCRFHASMGMQGAFYSADGQSVSG